jgi:hypothetical protein
LSISKVSIFPKKPKSSPLSYFVQKTSLNLVPNWYPIIFTCPVQSDSCSYISNIGALFDLQFVHNLFWLKLKWNARSKLFYCIIYRYSMHWWSSRTLTKLKSQSQKRFKERKYQYLKYKNKNHDKWYNKTVLIWRFTLVLIKINYGQIGDQTGLFYTTNPVFNTSGNRFVRRTGTFGNLIFSLVPSDNHNTRSTCPTSVFTGTGQSDKR